MDDSTRGHNNPCHTLLAPESVSLGCLPADTRLEQECRPILQTTERSTNYKLHWTGFHAVRQRHIKNQWRLLTNFSGGAIVAMMTKVTHSMGKLIGNKTIATFCYFLVNLHSNAKCNGYRKKLHPGVFNK